MPVRDISLWPDAMNGWPTCLSANIIIYNNNSPVNNVVCIDRLDYAKGIYSFKMGHEKHKPRGPFLQAPTKPPPYIKVILT